MANEEMFDDAMDTSAYRIQTNSYYTFFVIQH
jgi:hypothetical protein